jgi:DNA-binding NtrC family response regulator
MPQTVLFVDDDASLLAAFRRVFHYESFRLLIADSVHAARRLLAAERVDVLVCDHMMPGVSGTDFIAEVRVSHPDVIPIMMTGTADVNVAAAAISVAGVFRFFAKPCDAAEIAETIRYVLQHRETIVQSRRLLRDTLPHPALRPCEPPPLDADDELHGPVAVNEAADEDVNLDTLMLEIERSLEAAEATRVPEHRGS